MFIVCLAGLLLRFLAILAVMENGYDFPQAFVPGGGGWLLESHHMAPVGSTLLCGDAGDDGVAFAVCPIAMAVG